MFQSFIGFLLYDPKVDDRSRAVGKLYNETSVPISTFEPGLLSGFARSFVEFFWNTGVAYNFSLDMTETNNLGATVNVLSSLPSSKRSFGFSADFDRQRRNTRTFTLTDRFSNLLKIDQRYCKGMLAEENFAYPITGKIGVEPLVQDFVKLALFANLSPDRKTPNTAPTIVDELEFQTALGTSLTPKLTFTPRLGNLHIADAGLTAELTRKDVHKLTMGLSLASVNQINKFAAQRGTLFGSLLTAAGGGPEQAAAEAVNQALTRDLFRQTVILPR
ncbi:hypothetical protein [Methylobacterium sp. XJLW]|uniref:hypothetical protein n=1 Tax=Methylobacterium sp. XJLW TaxID=739141 RepID=UPI000F559ACE|nr:hypothetical protein [Methylobacterium sp. XJLW]